MCPICEGETLAQSDSPAAQRIKAYIQLRIGQGATRSQIKDELVEQSGARSSPPRRGTGSTCSPGCSRSSACSGAPR